MYRFFDKRHAQEHAGAVASAVSTAPAMQQFLRQERSGVEAERRFAAIVTGIVIGSVFAFFVVMGFIGFMRESQPVRLDIVDVTTMLGCCVLAVVPFAVSYHFLARPSHTLWRTLWTALCVALSAGGIVLTWLAV